MRSGRDGPRQPGSWPVRIAWFAGLWLAGIAVLGTVALIIRFWLGV
jgi:hypothetical protein